MSPVDAEGPVARPCIEILFTFKDGVIDSQLVRLYVSDYTIWLYLVCQYRLEPLRDQETC